MFTPRRIKNLKRRICCLSRAVKKAQEDIDTLNEEETKEVIVSVPDLENGQTFTEEIEITDIDLTTASISINGITGDEALVNYSVQDGNILEINIENAGDDVIIGRDITVVIKN